MDKFITLTSICNGEPIVVRVNSIAYMRSAHYKDYTLIRFCVTTNPKNSNSQNIEPDLAEIIVTESLDEVQRKMYR